MNELRQAVNDTLVSHLSDRFKASIDSLIARGVSKDGILAMVQGMAARAVRTDHPADAGRGKLTVAAVEAYLESK